MMRGSALAAVTLGLWVAGCRCEPEPVVHVAEASAPTVAECEPRTTEKLGIPFSKLCPQDLPVAGARFSPFWISAHPLGCSAGEHETLRCPVVTPLNHPAAGETRLPEPVPSRLATVIDANAAQGWCYMRFAGRLPTREERARAELGLGLAAVTVTVSSGEPTHFELARLAEWVTEEPCETPTIAKCKPGMYPSGERRPIAWDHQVDCSAAPLESDAGLSLLSVGESCPAPGFDWDVTHGRLPCAARSVAERGPLTGFALTCLRPGHAAPHPPDEPATTAAVRCVMPGTMR